MTWIFTAGMPRVVRAPRAVDSAAVVELRIHVLQEVGGADRRANGVALHLDRALLGFEHDRRVLLRLPGRGGSQKRRGEEGTDAPTRQDRRHRLPARAFPYSARR